MIEALALVLHPSLALRALVLIGPAISHIMPYHGIQNGSIHMRPNLISQILCAHMTSVVFALATKHEAISTGGCQSDDQAIASIFTSTAEAARTGVTALSCAGSAMGDLLLPRRSGAHRNNDNTPHDSVAVAIKSGVGGKTGSRFFPRNTDQARVLPAHEDLPVAGGGTVGSARKKGSAITSADNA